jgi:hypothetical protein
MNKNNQYLQKFIELFRTVITGIFLLTTLLILDYQPIYLETSHEWQQYDKFMINLFYVWCVVLFLLITLTISNYIYKKININKKQKNANQ